MSDVAQQPFVDDSLLGLAEVGRAAALQVDLHRSVILSGSFKHGLPFHYVHTDGLLHVHVHALLHRLDHRLRVPVVRRGNDHEVEICLRQHPAVVTIGRGPVAGVLPFSHVGRGLIEHLRIHVAKAGHFHGRHLQ